MKFNSDLVEHIDSVIISQDNLEEVKEKIGKCFEYIREHDIELNANLMYLVAACRYSSVDGRTVFNDPLFERMFTKDELDSVEVAVNNIEPINIYGRVLFECDSEYIRSVGNGTAKSLKLR